MKILFGWMREFVELALGPADAADRLVNAGVEVASVTPLAPGLDGVVVGEIEAIERELGVSHGHTLVLCRVTDGRARYPVVCGAPNAAPGLRTALARPGARLPGGRAIERLKLRDAWSEGMLCSERELGLGDEHEAGILDLGPAAPLGVDLVAHLGLDDWVLEVEVTPNRADCLSVIGVARELAALTGARYLPPSAELAEGDVPVDALARIRLEAPDLCPRFTARVIDGVRVGPSPRRIAQRLRAVGLRPINNVVDATNYVMWELGQPLHAFDWRTVTDATVVVRRARPGERLVTLDGVERALGSDMLVIADPARGMGLAGIMGGANTEIASDTTRVLLEVASFAPAGIRRTGRALGLRSDAGYRFERGTDLEALPLVSARATRLMVEIAGGRAARGLVDAYPEPRPRPRVCLREARLEQVLGVRPPRAEAARILAGLGLGVTDTDAGLEAEIPGFRRDLTMEDDLVEEVARVWGYDRIPATLAPGVRAPVRRPPARTHDQLARQALVAAGLHEVVTYAFGDPGVTAALGVPADGRTLELVNPLSRDAALLRRHPLEGVLRVLAANVRRRETDVAIFEAAKTYERGADGPAEPRWVALALAGSRGAAEWFARPEPVDVHDAQGLAEHVLAVLGHVGVPGPPGDLPGFEPDCSGALRGRDGRVLAEYGEVSAAARSALGLDVPVFAAAVALDVAGSLVPPSTKFEPLPRFPSVQRDLAFGVAPGHAVAAGDVEAAIAAAAGPLLVSVRLFDRFALPDGGRSLAWRLTFQAPDRTLTDDEVNAVHGRVARLVAARFGIAWRGGVDGE